MSDRLSIPPGPESLRVAEDRQRAANDRLEATLVGSALTDELRLEVVREIWSEMRSGGGNPHADLCRYEDDVKRRMGAQR